MLPTTPRAALKTWNLHKQSLGFSSTLGFRWFSAWRAEMCCNSMSPGPSQNYPANSLQNSAWSQCLVLAFGSLSPGLLSCVPCGQMFCCLMSCRHIPAIPCHRVKLAWEPWWQFPWISCGCGSQELLSHPCELLSLPGCGKQPFPSLLLNWYHFFPLHFILTGTLPALGTPGGEASQVQ